MEKQVGINNIQQLFDINGDYTNFKSVFKVTSNENKPFYIAVVDQNTLDNNDIQFKEAKGVMSGTVSSEKNIYQGFYLVLKANDPTIITISIKTEELPMKNLGYPDPRIEQQQPQMQQSQMQQSQMQQPPRQQPPRRKTPSLEEDPKPSNNLIRNLIILLLVVVILFLIYKFVTNKTIKESGFSFTSDSYY